MRAQDTARGYRVTDRSIARMFDQYVQENAHRSSKFLSFCIFTFSACRVSFAPDEWGASFFRSQLTQYSLEVGIRFNAAVPSSLANIPTAPRMHRLKATKLLGANEEERRINRRIRHAFEADKCTTMVTYHSHGIGVNSDDWVVWWRYLRHTGRGEVWLNQALLCLCILVKLADAGLAVYHTCVYIQARMWKRKSQRWQKTGKKSKWQACLTTRIGR